MLDPPCCDVSPRPKFLSVGLLTFTYLLALGFCPSAVAADRMTPIVRAVQAASPSIVNIQGQKSIGDPSDSSGRATRQVNGMGTGVVIDPRGYLLTNHHVVEGVRRINVTLSSGRTYIAQRVAHDKKTDLAIIRIRTPEALPVIRIGTSEDLMPGETVLAVGNAFGYENTVTTGIISALHRNVQVNDTQQYLDLIQTDASINPGNSGGPLMNIDGEMIGLNVAVRAGAQGIGFAIPVDKAFEVAARLMSIEQLDGHWHGMTALSVDGPKGPVSVARISRNSPAKASGLKRGDLLEKIGTVKIRRSMDVERALLGRRTGERVAMVVRRNGETVQLGLTVANRNTSVAKTVAKKQKKTPLERATWQSLGLLLTKEPRASLKELDLPYRGGMRVVSVRGGSSASKEGVREGDILVRVHDWPTASEQDLRLIVNRADTLARAGKVKFFIVRGTKPSVLFFGHMSVASRSSTSRR